MLCNGLNGLPTPPPPCCIILLLFCEAQRHEAVMPSPECVQVRGGTCSSWHVVTAIRVRSGFKRIHCLRNTLISDGAPRGSSFNDPPTKTAYPM